MSTLILVLCSNVYSNAAEGSIVIYSENLGLSFLVLGFSYAIFTLKHHSIEKKMLWSCTVGHISGIDKIKTLFGNEKIVVNYDYTVDDICYTNNMFDFTRKEIAPSQMKMNIHIKDFDSHSELKGEMVKVYYNSIKPWESAISRKGSISSLITVLPSVVITGNFIYAGLLIIGFI
ncbi:hypothetical protein [Psychromonas sp. SP041]|uniref:hypothetical protein n=1 Tax=Psychromonas sp. SP041 TaxID=1365007 RepID=UPI0010C78A1D|nr:hypothetical protein [Psychromonas sp. SP041]